MYLTKDMWPALEVFLITERKLGKNTLKYSRHRFDLLTKTFNDKEFNRANFNQYIYGLKLRGLSNSYINNLITLGKNIAKWQGLTEFDNYTYWKKEKKVVQVVTPQEIERMARIILPYPFHNEEKLNHYWKTAIYFLALTGCRVSEARNLKWNDCSEELVIFRETKNGDDRVFPMPRMLWELLDQFERKSEFVFCIRAGRQLDPGTLNKELKRRAEAIGIDTSKRDLHNHILRHSFISEMLKPKHGLTDSIIAHLVGHKSTQTTHGYNHPEIPELTEAVLQHPILNRSMTREMIVARFKELANVIVDKSRFNLTISENGGSFNLELDELDYEPVYD